MTTLTDWIICILLSIASLYCLYRAAR